MPSKKDLMDKAKVLKKNCQCNKPISGYNKAQLEQYINNKEISKKKKTKRIAINKQPSRRPPPLPPRRINKQPSRRPPPLPPRRRPINKPNLDKRLQERTNWLMKQAAKPKGKSLPTFKERHAGLWKAYMRDEIKPNNKATIEGCIKFKYKYGHPIRGWFRPGPDNTLADRKDRYISMFVKFFEFVNGAKYKYIVANYKKDFDKYFNTDSNFRQKVPMSKVPKKFQ